MTWQRQTTSEAHWPGACSQWAPRGGAWAQVSSCVRRRSWHTRDTRDTRPPMVASEWGRVKPSATSSHRLHLCHLPSFYLVVDSTCFAVDCVYISVAWPSRCHGNASDALPVAHFPPSNIPAAKSQPEGHRKQQLTLSHSKTHPPPKAFQFHR